MKLNFFSKVRDALREPYDPESMNHISIIYWDVLLLCAALIALGAFIEGMMGLGTAIQTVEGSQNSPVHTARIDRTKLDATIQGFSARTTRYQQISTDPPPIPDPVH